VKGRPQPVPAWSVPQACRQQPKSENMKNNQWSHRQFIFYFSRILHASGYYFLGFLPEHCREVSHLVSHLRVVQHEDC
jgi:hypothetical protein